MTVKIRIDNIDEIGKIINFHRKQAGLTRLALSEISGTGKTSVYDIEKGKDSIQINTIMKIMKALNISMVLTSPIMNNYTEKNR